MIGACKDLPRTHLDALVDFQPDLLYIDGPVGRPTVKTQMDWLVSMATDATLIFLDDVHREHIFDQIEILAHQSHCNNRLFIEYDARSKQNNCLRVLYAESVRCGTLLRNTNIGWLQSR